MVWAFVTGIVMGFPVGCYMREQGYSEKLSNAIHALRPNTTLRTDKFERTTGLKKREKYYKDL